jgi:hypothetical protein
MSLRLELPSMSLSQKIAKKEKKNTNAEGELPTIVQNIIK